MKPTDLRKPLSAHSRDMYLDPSNIKHHTSSSEDAHKGRDTTRVGVIGGVIDTMTSLSKNPHHP